MNAFCDRKCEHNRDRSEHEISENGNIGCIRWNKIRPQKVVECQECEQHKNIGTEPYLISQLRHGWGNRFFSARRLLESSFDFFLLFELFHVGFLVHSVTSST